MESGLRLYVPFSKIRYWPAENVFCKDKSLFFVFSVLFQLAKKPSLSEETDHELPPVVTSFKVLFSISLLHLN